MKLKSLTLKNFKAFEDIEFVFSDGINTIRGTNASGKSTIMDAFYWLSYGKDKLGRSDFEIKTRGETGVVHGLDHSVIAEFDSITLSRTYREKWTRRRGDIHDTFTGHETVFHINENPVKKSEYDIKVENLFGNYDEFRILSDPLYFSSTLDWQKRRAYVMKIAGDLNDIDVVNSDPERFERVPDLLEELDVEEAIAALKKKLTLSNKDLSELKLRVDETNKSLGFYRDAPEMVRDTKALDVQIDDISGQIANFETGPASLHALKAHEPLLLKRIEGAQYDREHRHNKKLAEYNDAVSEAKKSIEALNKRIEDVSGRAKAGEDLLAKMREEYHAISIETFAGDNKCYACGQQLPANTMAFNLEAWRNDKANRLKANKEEGLAKATELKKLNETLNKDREELAARIESLEILRSQAPVMDEPYEEEIKFQRTLDDLRAEIKNYKPEAGLEALKKQREALEAERDAIHEEIATYKAAKALRERLKELKAQQKEASESYQKIVIDIELLEAFFATKLDAMEASVFDAFGVRFTLFNHLINGGVEPACEVMVDSVEGPVPFAAANDAARATTGLKIIENLSKYLEKTVPVFIDNAEGIVSRFEDYGGQLIRLVVDENYKTITMMANQGE